MEQVLKFKNITALKLSRFFIYAFIFVLPFQIDVIIFARPIFESGNFNPFTSFFIYLGDIFLLLALITWGIAIFRNEYKEKISYGNSVIGILLILFLVMGEVSVIFAEERLLSFLIVLRFFELILLYFIMVNRVVKLNTVINIFIATVSLQAIFAIIQYLLQGSIGLPFLGEVNIGPDIYGIAKINLENTVFIRPYGTLPHANILSGFLLAGIFFSFHKIRQKEHLGYPLIFLNSAALVLTYSRSAFLALLIAFFVYISIRESRIALKYILFVAAIFIFFVVVFNLEGLFLNRILFEDISSFNERILFFNISKAMLIAFPLGVGLGNYTLLMSDFTNMKLDPWLYQPVHNIYMLITNEIGIIGLVVFILLLISLGIGLFYKMKKSQKSEKDLGAILITILVGFSVIGLFDHYLVSLYHGQVLLFLLIAFSGSYLLSNSKSEL